MLSVFTLGKMAECTKASTRRTKSMDLAFTHGQTRRSMLVGGVTASSMGLESLYQKKAERSWACGKMAKSSDGSLPKKLS